MGLTVAELFNQAGLDMTTVIAGHELLETRKVHWVTCVDRATMAATQPGDVLVCLSETNDAAHMQASVRDAATAGAAALLLRMAPGHVAAVRRAADVVQLPVIALPWDQPPQSIGTLLVGCLLQDGVFPLPSHQSWLQLLLDGATLPELVQALAERWQRPVLIVDDTDFPIATAGPCHQQMQAHLDHWQGQLAHSLIPFVVPADHLLIVPLVATLSGSGCLVTSYRGTLPTRLEWQQVQEGLIAIGLAMQQQRVTVSQWEEFLDELLAGHVVTAADMEARGRALRFTTAAPTAVVVGQANPAAPPEWTTGVVLLANQVATRRHVPLIGATIAGQIILLVNIGTAPTEMDKQLQDILAELEHAFSGYSVSWGVSEMHRGLEIGEKGYHEARSACQIGMIQQGPGHVTFITQLGGYRVLDKWRDNPESQHLWVQYLGPLLHAKHGKPTDLLQTLEVFLATQGNRSATARQMHLQRHALAYRLRRIEALTGCQLSDPADRFTLELSLRLYRLHELIGEAPVPRPHQHVPSARALVWHGDRGDVILTRFRGGREESRSTGQVLKFARAEIAQG